MQVSKKKWGQLVKFNVIKNGWWNF
jgi:hypothetical protein